METFKSGRSGRLNQSRGSRRGSLGGGRRNTIRLVIIAFGVATVSTSVVSLGTYCLTTDGGDFRRIRASGTTGQSAAEKPDAVGSSCALPAAAGQEMDTAAAASNRATTTGRSEPTEPPIDRVPRPELKTATFALG